MLTQIKPVQPDRSRDSEARPRMSYAQFLKSDGDPHVEWVNGEVVKMAPVSDEHSDLQSFLHGILKIFVDAKDLGRIRAEPFQMKPGPGLPGRAPDVLFVSKRNLAKLKKNHLAGAADVVVEIISPGSRSVDRGEKYYEYEAGGVREYWLIDPIRKTAEFYVLGRDRKFDLAPVEDVFHSTVLKGLWLNIGWLWQNPRPSVLLVLQEWKLV